MPDHDQHHSHSFADGASPQPDRADLTGDFSFPDPAPPRSVAAPAAPPRLNAGRYEMLDEIAHGGMGVIWRATDTTLGREVAVKVLRDKFAPDSGTARRFADEARITAQLQHPAIPPVHDCGALPDGRPFLAMKLIKGRTLEDLLCQRSDPAAERGRFVAVFEQVCQAVAYAHAHQVIHRDLKPGNVMVGSFGEVQVMDWGLAKVLTEKAVPIASDTDPGETVAGTLIRGSDPDGSDGSYTQAGSILGTLAYMPPEQAAGEVGKVDQRSDVFGLGAVLTVILTGTPPYTGTDVESTRVMAIRGDLAACLAQLDGCDAEPELVALCKRCLAFAPADRPLGAGAVAEEVAGLRAATEERARAAERERAAAEVKVAEQRKQRRWQAAVVGAGVLILALLGGGAWWMDHQAAEREKDRAVAAERDRQEAAAMLAQAEEVLGAGDLSAADLALTHAEGRIGEGGPADLRDRLAVAKRDRNLVRDLRELDGRSWVPDAIGAEPADRAGKYRAAFARFGLDVGGEDPNTAADAVGACRVSAELVAGLCEWCATDPASPGLGPLLDRLDPDPDRAAIRAAIQAGDEGRVRALVGAHDGSKVPVWFAVSVGFHRMVPFEDGVRLMTAAWRTHSGYYPLAFRIAVRLGETAGGRLPEMLAWARVAVALRPDSPYPHYLVARAWQGMHNWAEAEASARRAIELGKKYPRSAGGHVTLGNVLLDKGDLDGAEASYRAALAVDPDAAGIYFNMGLVYDRLRDLAAAEQWYRKTVAAAPADKLARETLNVTIRRRAERARMDEVDSGRANPASAAEAIRLAEFAHRSFDKWYGLAVRLYRRAFAIDPALADDLDAAHRYSAAWCAVQAAAGKDEEMTARGVEEWGHLTGLALAWLRADLRLRASQAKDPKRWPEVRKALTHWKHDTGLASVRDPVWLAAMPPVDRKGWEALWRDVDAVLASTSKQAGTSSP
jgi:eukaryotic-like serine/threonine-protein kinase